MSDRMHDQNLPLRALRALCLATMFLSLPVAALDDYVLEEKFRNELVKAEKGDAKAQFAIGEMYQKGRGTEKNERTAFSWYSKAAGQGHAKAEYKLGMAYLAGKGIRRNLRKAHEWLKKSADAGYARAQYQLAGLYEKGQGTEVDLDKAEHWYRQALQGGYDAAADGLRRVAQLKTEAQARAAQATVNRNPAPKPKKISRPAPPPPAQKKTPTTSQRLLAGGWKKRGKPVEFLPSAITRCSAKKDRIECQSETLSRRIGMADIDYQTQAVISRMRKDGSFEVTYRNNVIRVTAADEDAATGGNLPIKTGLQDARHTLSCKLTDDRHITCTKNKLRRIELER